MELNHKVLGTGHPLVIIHGLFGMLDNWQTVGRNLADDYMVYLVDAPNHGKSPDIDIFTYPIVAEYLHVFLESQWIHESYLMGHSMGGKIAMQQALQFPDSVEKLIVVDIAPKQYTGGHQEIFDAMRSIDVSQFESRRDIQKQLSNRLKSQAVILFLMKNLSRRKTGGYHWKFNLNGLYHDYDHILSSVSGKQPFENPTLFIRGESSGYISDADWSEIQTLFPNSELVTINGAGHWVHADKPDELIGTVRRFLEQ